MARKTLEEFDAQFPADFLAEAKAELVAKHQCAAIHEGKRCRKRAKFWDGPDGYCRECCAAILRLVSEQAAIRRARKASLEGRAG